MFIQYLLVALYKKLHISRRSEAVSVELGGRGTENGIVVTMPNNHINTDSKKQSK